MIYYYPVVCPRVNISMCVDGWDKQDIHFKTHILNKHKNNRYIIHNTLQRTNKILFCWFSFARSIVVQSLFCLEGFYASSYFTVSIFFYFIIKVFVITTICHIVVVVVVFILSGLKIVFALGAVWILGIFIFRINQCLSFVQN